MVRNYRPDPVPPASIERLVEIARKAPSAGFSQGQRFVIVTDEQGRRAIAELAEESRFVDEGFEPWLSAAPVHVVVCVAEGAYRTRYAAADKSGPGPADWPVSYPLLDCGASLMLLLLAAVDEGLSAGFMGIHRFQGISDLLDIPPDVTPVGVVTIGHPAPDRRSSSLESGWLPLEEVLHWGRWGGERP